MILQGTTAVVTGASSGIGRATALALSRRGCQVVVCGRDRARVEEVARLTGGDAVVADFAVADEVLELGETLAARGAPDLVVNNAGVGLAGPVEQLSGQDADRLLAVNYVAPVLLTRTLLPGMRGRGSGRLVFVTSIAGVLGAPREGGYAASKAALHTFAASLALELSGSGVGVTRVVPGVVATGFFDQRGVPYQRRRPRPLPPERVAGALVRAVERDHAQVVVPGWLRVPMALSTVAPQTYARLASRWA